MIGMASIPPGSVTSYGALAAAARSPRAARAAGSVVGANPLGVVVPCHRVIGANGALTGFGGGLPLKVALLGLEEVAVTQI
ncbi:MAG: methylated-DNA--[protein]-cysteine S-methyltransferase [Firmicutes bacterium]|nr:methylated-DNA--[protein]-cysteine S-methyltransferase [Bacillota bacterium]